jgi:PTH1 family peptidyl-tRNA hydrolase
MIKKGKQVDYVLMNGMTQKTGTTRTIRTMASEIIKSFGTAGLENTMTAL